MGGVNWGSYGVAKWLFDSIIFSNPRGIFSKMWELSWNLTLFHTFFLFFVIISEWWKKWRPICRASSPEVALRSKPLIAIFSDRIRKTHIFSRFLSILPNILVFWFRLSYLFRPSCASAAQHSCEERATKEICWGREKDREFGRVRENSCALIMKKFLSCNDIIIYTELVITIITSHLKRKMLFFSTPFVDDCCRYLRK